MKLYDGAAASPRRVRIYLAAKGLELPTETVDLAAGENLSPGFLAKNPAGMTPALELDDGTVLSESMAICRYLEALHPDPPLFGRTPTEIGLVEMWSRRVELEGMRPLFDVFRNLATLPRVVERPIPGAVGMPRPGDRVVQSQEVAARGLRIWGGLAAQLDAHLGGREFLATDAFTVADITLVVTVDVAQRLAAGVAGAAGAWDAARYPSIREWRERVAALGADVP